MGLLELFLIAVGLSMDAFAVSVCKGLERVARSRLSTRSSADCISALSAFNAAHRLCTRRALSVAHHEH